MKTEFYLKSKHDKYLYKRKPWIFIKSYIFIGIQGVPIGGAQPRALPLQYKILPQYLKELGYRTSLVGKWHLGFYKKEFTPLERGFDSFFGYYNGLIDYYNYIYDDPVSINLRLNLTILYFYNSNRYYDGSWFEEESVSEIYISVAKWQQLS